MNAFGFYQGAALGLLAGFSWATIAFYILISLYDRKQKGGE